jgi:hypothetical protein
MGLHGSTAPQRGRQTCSLSNSPHRQPTLSSMECVTDIRRASNSSNCRTTTSCSEEEIIRWARGQNIGLYAPEPWLVCTYGHILSLCMFFFQTSQHTKHSQRRITVGTSGGKKWSRPYPSRFLTQCWHRVFNKWANWPDGRKCYCWCWIQLTTSHLIDNTKRHSTKPQHCNLITHSPTELVAYKDRSPRRIRLGT